jgi:hypothetical protein
MFILFLFLNLAFRPIDKLRRTKLRGTKLKVKVQNLEFRVTQSNVELRTSILELLFKFIDSFYSMSGSYSKACYPRITLIALIFWCALLTFFKIREISGKFFFTIFRQPIHLLVLLLRRRLHFQRW